VDRLFAELMGKATGINSGMGGSMHLSDFGVGSLGETSIVGSGDLPAAPGPTTMTRFTHPYGANPARSLTFGAKPGLGHPDHRDAELGVRMRTQAGPAARVQIGVAIDLQ
jgi:hypothetical protein